MANKAETISANVKTHVGQEEYDQLTNGFGGLGDKPTPAQQAKRVAPLINRLHEKYGSEKVEEIMRPCGFSCISDNTIAKAKKLYSDSRDMNEFLSKLNQNRIGGGKLRIDGDKIIGIYEKCYCGLARSAENLSSDYCYCSAGWFQKLFSSVFNKNAAVKKVKTILDGADECVFEIYI